MTSEVPKRTKPTASKKPKVGIPAHLRMMDRVLVEKGYHPISPFWLRTFDRFFSGGKRTLIARCGRRAGKSSSVARLAVCIALYGEYKVSKGEKNVIAFISVSQIESTARLATVKSILSDLGVAWRPVSDGVELEDYPIVFRSLTSSVRAVSGWTTVFCFVDECAKLLSEDGNRNPASEVVAALVPTMASQPNARMVLASSPLGTQDYHAKRFALGSTEDQDVAFCESWVGNPTLTREDCQKLERDERKFLREFCAIPTEDDEEGILTAIELDAKHTTRKSPEIYPPEEGLYYIASTDPASRGNSWSLVVAARRKSNAAGNVRDTVIGAWEWQGKRSQPLDPDQVMREISEIVAPYEIDMLHTDQHAADFLQAIARRYGLFMLVEPWTGPSKLRAFEQLRAKVQDGSVELSPNKNLRQDILNTKMRITGNGESIQFTTTSDNRHCDFSPALASALIALDKFGVDPVNAGPEPGTPAWIAMREQQMKEARRQFQSRDYARRTDARFWKVHPSERIR